MTFFWVKVKVNYTQSFQLQLLLITKNITALYQFEVSGGGAHSALRDPLAGGKEASFPVSKNLIPAINHLGLWLQPFGPHPWPEIGGLAHPNTTGTSNEMSVEKIIKRILKSEKT